MEKLGLMNTIIESDLGYIYDSLSREEKDKLKNANILITGCAGFLGFYLCHFFTHFSNQLKIKSIVGTDIFLLDQPQWLKSLDQKYENFHVSKHDIAKDDIGHLISNDISHVIHLASIASPAYYRKYPLITIEGNIWGLKNLLEYFKNKSLKGFLFFSSSEIYGDPHKDFIPTDESYPGYVSCIGPRACYDESKRFGETLCQTYAAEFDFPVTIARPFNNYGPGMSINDKRVPADFAKSILSNKNIEIFSDGTPTRTFCYISDAVAGYLKVLLHNTFDFFNIGIESPEISIADLANIYKKIGTDKFKYTGEVVLAKSLEKDYLTDNPNRRCPDIKKARSILQYNPRVTVDEGVSKFLEHLNS